MSDVNVLNQTNNIVEKEIKAMNMEFLSGLSGANVIEAAKNREAYENNYVVPEFDKNRLYWVFVKNYFLTADYRHHCLEVVVKDNSSEKDFMLVYNNDGKEFQEFDIMFNQCMEFYGPNEGGDNYEAFIGFLFTAYIEADSNHVSLEVVENFGNLLI